MHPTQTFIKSSLWLGALFCLAGPALATSPITVSACSPAANPCPTLTISLSGTAPTLTGTASGGAGPLSYTWTQLSGPNNDATDIVSPNSLSTLVIISGALGDDPGTYVFQLTATDGTNSASSTVTVIANAVNPATLAGGSVSGLPGGTVVYPLNFTPSPDDGTYQLAATVVLPAGLSYVSAALGPAHGGLPLTINTTNPFFFTMLSFSGPPLTQGTIVNVTLQIAPGTPPGPLTVGWANVSAGDSVFNTIPINTVNGTVTVEAASPPALTLTKSASPASANSGQTVTFTINYQNTSSSNATNAVITDVVPAGSTLVSGSISNGGTVSGNTITWNLGTVAGNAAGSVSFNVIAN